MVDLGQTGGRDSACLFFKDMPTKNRLLSQSVLLFNRLLTLCYFSVAYNLATSVQLITLKKASI